MVFSDETAKAAQEVAKLGQRSLETANRAGGYFAETFKEAIGHIAAAASDSAEAFRIRNRASVLVKTKAKLAALGVTENYRAIEDRVAVPLIEAISVEGDETIQDAWAGYISNALDPDKPHITINRILIGVIRSLEPEDLPILRRIFEIDLGVPVKDAVKLIPSDFELSDAAINYTLARLLSLGLFSFSNVTALLLSGGNNAGIGHPCRVEISTSMGAYSSLPLLLLLKQATD
jgi:hypothetical protein